MQSNMLIVSFLMKSLGVFVSPSGVRLKNTGGQKQDSVFLWEWCLSTFGVCSQNKENSSFTYPPQGIIPKNFLGRKMKNLFNFSALFL